MKKGDHLFLVDGSGYIFRAYHALPPLTRKSDGLPVGAVSGFCNMLWKLMQDARNTDVGITPTHFAVIFDYSSKTFRNELYAEYKANRSAPPEDLVPQFGLRRWLEIRLAEKLGIVANVEFAAPAEYAWRLLRAANPGLAAVSGYEREILRWRIFALLPALAREPGREALAAALGDGDQSTRLRFADALAHAYERDLAYRSDRLAAWERGVDAGDWRAELWRRLVQSSSQPHRAALLAA